MTEERNRGSGTGLMVAGAAGGAAVTALIAMLLARRPAAGAPVDEKLEYFMSTQEAIVEAVKQLVADNIQIIDLLTQLCLNLGIDPGDVSSILTRWEARDPVEIYNHAIRAAGTFNSNQMVEWTTGKRMLIKVESTLDQPSQIQVIGNIFNDFNTATNIGAFWPCPANDRISVGLAWDDWHPFIGVRATLAVAPASGLLQMWSVVQE